MDARAAIGRHYVGQPRVQISVNDESARAKVVLDEEVRLAGQDVDSIEVVKLRFPVIDSDHHLVREPVRWGFRHSMNPVVGSQVSGLSGLDVDRVNVPVLVTSSVLDVHDVAGVVSPEVEPDASVSVLCHRTGVLDGIDRRDPDVENPSTGARYEMRVPSWLILTSARSGFPNSVFLGINSGSLVIRCSPRRMPRV